jgi:hypothetical protein
MDLTSECITGPCVDNQLYIYGYRSDLWSGIIFWIVDDTESNFYKLKLSCVEYIANLCEGLNIDIITLIGSNFSA